MPLDFLFPVLLGRARYLLRMLVLVPLFLGVGLTAAQAAPDARSLVPVALVVKLGLAHAVQARLQEAGVAWLYRLGVAVSLCFIGEGIAVTVWTAFVTKVLGLQALATPSAILMAGMAIEASFAALALLAAVLPNNGAAYIEKLTRQIESAPQTTKQSAKLYFARARAFASLNRNVDAAADFEKAQELNPRLRAKERVPGRLDQAAARCLDDDRHPEAR